jgi:hypothetical protein
LIDVIVTVLYVYTIIYYTSFGKCKKGKQN